MPGADLELTSGTETRPDLGGSRLGKVREDVRSRFSQVPDDVALKRAIPAYVLDRRADNQ